MSRIFKAEDIILDKKITNIGTGLIKRNNFQDEKLLDKKMIENNNKKSNVHSNTKEKEIMFLAKVEAEKIIKNAYVEARKIVEEEKAKIFLERDSIFQKSKNDGYSEGYKKGIMEVDLIKEKINKTYQEAIEKKDMIVKELEPELIDLIVDCSKKILNAKLIVNPSVIKNVINQGLNESTLIGDVFIRVSNEFYDVVIKSKDEILSNIEGSSNIEILKDLSFEGGDCIIETPFGNIDCSLDEQLSELKENLYIIMG